MSTKDIIIPELPSKPILNTTLVNNIQLIDESGLKYDNKDLQNKVYIMLEDNQTTLKIIIKKIKPCQILLYG